MPYVIALLITALLSACSWETYQDGHGKIGIRQKHQLGTPVVYQDGTYSKNLNNSEFRPEKIVVNEQTLPKEQHHPRNVQWQKQPSAK